MKIKRGDKVVVIAGKDKGKQGKVVKVFAKTGKLIVENVNMVKKHRKPNAANQQGGIVDMEAPIDAANVMYLHNGKPTRLGYKVEVEEGKKIKTRIAKSTGEAVD